MKMGKRTKRRILPEERRRRGSSTYKTRREKSFSKLEK